MGRRYRRYRSGRGGNNSKAGAVMALIFVSAIILRVFVSLLIQYWRPILIVAIVISTCVIIAKLIQWYNSDQTANQSPASCSDSQHRMPQQLSNNSQKVYTARKSIMTDCEKEYYAAIKKVVGPTYSIQPQVNLASVIDKISNEKYRNELFRNVDFGVFDSNYRLIVLIEINDQTHNLQERKIRDAKVHAICEEAGIPIITFWTQFGINEQYMKDRLSQYLALNTANRNENTPIPPHLMMSTQANNEIDTSNLDNTFDQSVPEVDVELDLESIVQEFSSEQTV